MLGLGVAALLEVHLCAACVLFVDTTDKGGQPFINSRAQLEFIVFMVQVSLQAFIFPQQLIQTLS